MFVPRAQGQSQAVQGLHHALQKNVPLKKENISYISDILNWDSGVWLGWVTSPTVTLPPL
jgi:hypothetical protein